MKRSLFVILVIAILTSARGELVESAQAKYSGGSGTAGDPYKIGSAADLSALGANTGDYNKYFILTADIDLASAGPFTTGVIASDLSFIGDFNGNNHTISNLTINTSGASNSYLGLFGKTNSGAQVKNLGLQNVSITGGSSSQYLGGLVGYSDGSSTIGNCYSTGAVTGGNSSQYLGGLVGWNGCNINNCHSTGDVNGGDYSANLGGLVGDNGDDYHYGSISNCYSTGTVSGGTSSSDLGGLVGGNYGTDSNSYSTGSVTGGNSSSCIGGLAGWNGYNINNCYSTSDVNGGDVSGYIGGLVGYNSSIIRDCYSAGTVSGGTSSSDLGGLVGYNEYGTTTTTACFWDTITSGQIGSDGGTGKTTSEMQTESTFTNAGWDFVGETANGTNDIWFINEGVDYPRFLWRTICTLPLAPTGVSASDGNYTDKVRVTWDSVSGATGYEVWRSNDSNSSSASKLGDYTSPFDDSSIIPGTTYYYWVKAGNDCGMSGFSSSDSGTSVPTRIIGLSGDLAFGSVTVGSSPQRILTINNTGSSTMTVSSISYPSGFSGAWSGTIAAGGSQPVTVTFSPTSVTGYGGTITVNSDMTSGTNTIAASGTGTLTPTRIISLSGYLAFGSVEVETSSQSTLTINNTGDSTMTVSSISYPVGFSGAWSGTIAAGGSHLVTVTFSPTSATSYSGTVTVISDKTSGTNTIAASGTGTLTPTRIIGLSGNLAFGGVIVGSSSQRILTINNTGNSTMTVSSISYPSGFSGDWSGAIAAGGSQPVTVTFSPTSAISYGGTVTVNSDMTSGTNTINASGTGHVPRTVLITKCSVAAGSKPNSDTISISGTMDANANDFNDANAVVITIDSNGMVSPCVKRFPINGKTFRNGKFNGSALNASFALDTKTTKFSFIAKNVSLKGLSCPLTGQIEIGDYIGTAQVDEDIVNGGKPIPLNFLMGVKDSLRVDGKPKFTKKSGSITQLTVSGWFSDKNVNDVNLLTNPLNSTLGPQTFTIPAHSFKNPTKGKFTCSKVTLSGGETAVAIFDFNKCTFTLTIKNTSFTAAAGTADFCITFASFSECAPVALP